MSAAALVPLALVAVCLLMAMLNPRLLERRRRAQQRAADLARAEVRRWIHAINTDRCTGCEACIEVCPTFVLELVDHKSSVVRRDGCIECRQCAQACPTTALVMHREGEEPPTLRVPEIDGSLMTAVPGQYLIGEVAGKPLVKNAANMGRLVVEHMVATGLRPGAGSGASSEDPVDVAIVGSGPGGLSAALTCRHHGLGAVVLEKEALIASTVARYPRGKGFLAEPVDCANLSFLPVFDTGKEQLVAAWSHMAREAALEVRTGCAVDEVDARADGLFELKCGRQVVFARRVVLAIGTRGKPRTLGVPGESLVKVATMLDDPEAHRGQSVLVVGGGDSALEAACALVEGGARRVTLSYRGKSFARAKKRNRDALDRMAAAGTVELLLGSQVVQITDDSVVIQLAGGEMIENHAVYVLIGADAPLKWLEKCGVRCVDRPHAHRFGATDQLLAAFGVTSECPADVDQALWRVFGRKAGRAAASPAAPSPRSSGSVSSLSSGSSVPSVPSPPPPTSPPARPSRPAPAAAPDDEAPTHVVVAWECAPRAARPAPARPVAVGGDEDRTAIIRLRDRAPARSRR
ncbi:MAG TPA: NAD(P)-binding domain-containing protein [Kofleriaceae bacterium]|nr:NAD(P)-binding domain-containing protein [Kofleriaceae bacterium]